MEGTNDVNVDPGRWAQRVDTQGITVKSHYNADSVIPFPAPKLDSAAEEQSAGNSKDSSIEPYKQQNVSGLHFISNNLGAFVACPSSSLRVNEITT